MYQLVSHFEKSDFISMYVCVCVYICIYIYTHTHTHTHTHRVFQDLWTLLQEVISQVFVIKKVHINMCLILDGYGVMTA